MQPTRRFWEVFGVAATLAAVAVLVARPLLLVPAGVVLAWLLAMQVGFVHALGILEDSLTVEQTLARPVTAVDAPVTLTVSADGDAGPLDVDVTVRPASGLVVDDDRATFGADTHVAVESAIAGRHRVRPPEIAVGDPAGLFLERVTRGPEVTLRVEARVPDRLHVGEGGTERRSAYGDHPGERFGSGLVPAEIREYQPGEPATMIDWKTTARMGEAYVRKFEADTDLTSMIVIDTRAGLAVGRAGETAMDYLRAAALSYLADAAARSDPVGCLGVTDEGVERWAEPSATAKGYDRAREALTDATAEADGPRHRRAPPLGARAGTIRTDSRFGRTLAAYAGSRPGATESDEPLADAVRAAVDSGTGPVQVAIFTDDADRAAVRQAVAAARPDHNRVAVFMAPRILFEPGGLGDRSSAVETYRGFERFRQDLAAIDNVSAYEVAPRDRLEAVLEAGAIQ